MSVAHFCVFYAQDANNQRRARLRVILEERKHKEQSASNLVAALFSKTPKRAQVCVCVRVIVTVCALAVNRMGNLVAALISKAPKRAQVVCVHVCVVVCALAANRKSNLVAALFSKALKRAQIRVCVCVSVCVRTMCVCPC